MGLGLDSDCYCGVPRTRKVDGDGPVRVQPDELTLPYPMRKLQPGDRRGRGFERLKALHRATLRFDGTVVLLNDIVEVLRATNSYPSLRRMLSA